MRLDGIDTTFWRVRKVVVEVSEPLVRAPWRDGFDVGYLLENMRLGFFNFRGLEEMDVLINACSLAALIPRKADTGPDGGGRDGYCPKHKEYIGQWQVFREMAEFLDGRCQPT